MNFGRISTSKCRGMLQKMGCCVPNPLQEAQALATYKGLKFKKKKGIQKIKIKTSVLVYPGGGPRPAGDRCGPRSPSQ
jgi:hypothetical protein